MAATTAERIVYAAKSRKWNSTQNNKFPVEFPAEHAANLEWIKKAGEEAARRQTEEESRVRDEQQKIERDARQVAKRKSDSAGKWILIGIIGIIVAMRAWQRYNESTL